MHMARTDGSTKENVDRRRAEVERIILAGQWTGLIRIDLAAEWNCDGSTLRRDAAYIRRQWKKEAKKVDKEDAELDWLMRTKAASAMLFDRGDKGDAAAGARLLAEEARVLGIQAPEKVELGVKVQVSIVAPREKARRIVGATVQACRLLGIEESTPIGDLVEHPVLDVIDVV